MKKKEEIISEKCRHICIMYAKVKKVKMKMRIVGEITRRKLEEFFLLLLDLLLPLGSDNQSS